jgi:flagellar assembly factor FliW
MKINTKAYGPVDIDKRQIIYFPMGLFGFEKLHEYALLDASQQPFYWLQSLDSEKIAFILIKPHIFRPDYKPGISSDELKEIELDNEAGDNSLIFSIVNIPEEQQNKMTANLQGPVIINKEKRTGAQFISQDTRWKVKHYILEELGSRKQEKESAC